ncbi:MAG: acyl-CoA synthetase [Cellvibrionaceae bacterium]|nr:acyl-CoA synthetase [Cellvibrionaceae bacterium]MCV6625000.1 acyl-CoA synthetase [Cellvibrionaceae bacterium]
MANIYEQGLAQNGANFTALTPLNFIERAAHVYPEHLAVVHGKVRRNWRETYQRCRQLASALVQLGIGKGDTVSVVAPNVPEMVEAHFGVPMCGAVLNAINIRLDAAAIGFILAHAEAKVVLVDREFGAVVEQALAIAGADLKHAPLVITIDDPSYHDGKAIGSISYDDFIAAGDPNYAWQPPADEWEAISLNYTSGTTGNPKGVVYHHRGASQNAINNILSWDIPRHPNYLWTLPLFHCNGWCFPWTIAAQAGTNVCLRQVRADLIFELIRAEKVSHFCGAPIVLNLLNNADDNLKQGIEQTVKTMTAGAAPPAAVIQGMEELGIEVTHTYGLTETYGPSVVCAWHDHWDQQPIEERARLKSRQGVRYPMLEGLMVADSETLEEVPHDGETIGEVMMRGNVVMKGYLKNPSATEESFAGGWFHSGDLAVCHPDGYIELKDRSKDIIISGGENISSIEVEGVLYQHPAILEAAVVAKLDDKWGEVPCAFITVKAGVTLSEQEIIGFCRERMAHFKAPKAVVFGELPKTSTGKIQKFVLREQANQ